MTDPYRDSAVPLCPHCRDPLEGGPESFTCPRDHGEWMSSPWAAAMPLENVARLGTRSLHCPTCQHPMQWLKWGTVELDSCAHHGIWIGTSDLPPFHERVAEERDRERGEIELVARLSTPAGQREVVRRLLALEREVAALRALVEKKGKP